MNTRLVLSLTLTTIVSLAAPAIAEGFSYQVEARIVSGGEVVGTPVVSAPAHEPASVTLPASQNRTLVFWAVVKPMKKKPECHKVMVRVILKGAARRYVWNNDYAEMCGDETKVFTDGDLTTTLRIQPENPQARQAP